MKKVSINAVRERVAELRAKRQEIENLGNEVKDEIQPELIDTLTRLGVDNEVGVVYDPSDKSKGAAYVQQNKPGEYWDEEAILNYLKKRKSLWMGVSSRVLDYRKLEAEIANGNIPKATVNKWRKKKEPSAPFIRFGKITDKSL